MLKEAWSVIDQKYERELSDILVAVFAAPSDIADVSFVDQGAGQDAENVQFFINSGQTPMRAYDIVLNGAYALPYFSFAGLRNFLPKIMIAAMVDGFRYQPVLDSIVIGATDTKNNWGRHIENLSHEQKSAIHEWLTLLKQTERYDPYLIQNAAACIL
jgi:hypothetical protein